MSEAVSAAMMVGTAMAWRTNCPFYGSRASSSLVDTAQPQVKMDVEHLSHGPHALLRHRLLRDPGGFEGVLPLLMHADAHGWPPLVLPPSVR
jgi:hypothetical protein